MFLHTQIYKKITVHKYNFKPDSQKYLYNINYITIVIKI